MAENDNTKGVAEFLAAPIGGGVIALLLWFVLKRPCGPLELECVTLGSQEFYSPGALLAIGGVIGLAVAVVIHIVRS